jgi:hypothetical protein
MSVNQNFLSDLSRFQGTFNNQKHRFEFNGQEKNDAMARGGKFAIELCSQYYVPMLTLIIDMAQSEDGVEGTCAVLQNEINFNMYQFKVTQNTMCQDRAINCQKALITARESLMGK